MKMTNYRARLDRLETTAQATKSNELGWLYGDDEQRPTGAYLAGERFEALAGETSAALKERAQEATGIVPCHWFTPSDQGVL
jgi:hypothetical protein